MMNFKESFCPSPWFHMCITNQGDFEYCRWAGKQHKIDPVKSNIVNQDPVVFFQQEMSEIRKSMLDGIPISACSECHVMDRHKKVSGRQKQLLKIGVNLEYFEKSLLTSDWVSEFKKTHGSEGRTNQWPQDWQIDLGNYCNSACVFCTPSSSSRLATEFKKLGMIQDLPPNDWCNDQKMLDRFVDVLKQSPNLAYLHFLGGETLITPGFRRILQSIIDSGLNTNTSIGFTTNLTVWDDSMIDLLTKFKEVNLGMSVECMHDLNDYVRYGSSLSEVKTILEKWLIVGKNNQWLIQLRTTPTVFSIWHLDTIYYYALERGIAIESCNFLENPAFMKISVLPKKMRDVVSGRLERFIERSGSIGTKTIVNTRDPNRYRDQIVQDAQSYINYMKSTDQEDFRAVDLVKYIKILENNRGNRILDYLPEYEEFLRSFGY